MAETETAPVEEGSAEVESASEPRSGILGKIKIGAFIAVVVLTECMVAYLYVPSKSELTAMAEQRLAEESEDFVDDPEESAPGDSKELSLEIDLGQFDISVPQPVSNTTFRISFHLYGTIAEDDESDFTKKLTSNAHRIRDQVITIVRSSELTDLNDPGLGLIRRKILEKTNRTLGKSYLRTVMFPDFSLIEQ